MYQITFGFSHTLFFELEALVLDYHTRRISRHLNELVSKEKTLSAAAECIKTTGLSAGLSRHQELEPECSLANCF